jgi:hypothetical protein
MIPILSIIITVIVAIPATVYAIRAITKNRIAYVQFDLISIVRTLAKDFKDFQLLHKGKPVDTGIYLLRGALFNTGNNDLDSAVVHKPLEMHLPKGYEIIDVRVGETLAQPKVSSRGETLVFEWVILKKREYIPFNVLLRIPLEVFPERKYGEPAKRNLYTEVLKQVEFTERIVNLGKIKKVNAHESNLVVEVQDRVMLGVSIGLLGLVLAAYLFTNVINPSRIVAYRYAGTDGIERTVQFSPKKADTVSITELSSKYKTEVAAKELGDGAIRGIVIVRDPKSTWSLILTILSPAMLAVIYIGVYIGKLRRRKRYGQLISIFRS